MVEAQRTPGTDYSQQFTDDAFRGLKADPGHPPPYLLLGLPVVLHSVRIESKIVRLLVLFAQTWRPQWPKD